MGSADEKLSAAIEEIVAAAEGVVGVAVRDLRRQRALDLRADEPFPAASVIKVPILVELLARVEEGDFRLEDRLFLRDAEKMPGSGVLSFMHAGLELTLEDLAYLMICVSDNTASNMLIDLLGIDRIDQRLRSLGLTVTTLQRRLFDTEARAQGRDNWAAAGEMADLLTAMEQRRLVSAAASEKMLAIMRRQQFDNKIPRLLPPNTPVANKTGTISTASHDVGIIYSPAGPLVLAVLTRDVSDAAAAEGVIRHMARAAYIHWGAG